MRCITLTTGVKIPLTEFDFAYSRSSGAGGQNVNKVSSRATLRWAVRASNAIPSDLRYRFLTKFQSRITNEGELLISSDTSRNQAQNVEECIEKLTSMLESVARPPKQRRATKPTYGSKQRRIASKKRRGEVKAGRGKFRDGE